MWCRQGASRLEGWVRRIWEEEEVGKGGGGGGDAREDEFHAEIGGVHVSDVEVRG